MTEEKNHQEPKPLSRSDKRILTCVIVVLSGYFVWLTMFSPGPQFYSYEENARATKACENHKDPEWCLGDFLLKWRKENPDSPRGSR